MDKSSLARIAMEVARTMANRQFAGDPDRETKTADAVSSAWEMAQGAPDKATPGMVAWIAVKRVKIGRQFSESTRSMDGPNPKGRKKPAKVVFHLEEIGRPGANPANLARFRIDFREWLATLNAKQTRVLKALALGDRTDEAAERFGLTAGRISQYRRELWESWKGYLS